MAKAYAPYSKFPVGAAIRTEDGRIFAGANIEVASFPEGWCAETTALGHYVMAGGGTISEIAVVAERMARITPCGGCRQRLAEFAGPDAKLYPVRRDRRGGDGAAGRHAALWLRRRGAAVTDAAKRLAERLGGLAPATAIVLGSGLSGLVDQVEDAVRIPYGELPGFPASGVTGHAGMAVAGRFGGQPVLMLAGRAHYYEHGDAAAMRPVIETLAGVGVSRAASDQRGRVARSRDAAGLGDADHRSHQFLRHQPAVRRAERPSLRRADRGLRPGAARRDRGGRGGQRHRAPQGRLHVVLRPVLRDAGRDPHGAPARRPSGRHVDRAGGDPRPLLRPPGGRLLGHHQPRRRDDGRGAVASGDQGHGAARRRRLAGILAALFAARA